MNKKNRYSYRWHVFGTTVVAMVIMLIAFAVSSFVSFGSIYGPATVAHTLTVSAQTLPFVMVISVAMTLASYSSSSEPVGIRIANECRVVRRVRVIASLLFGAGVVVPGVFTVVVLDHMIPVLSAGLRTAIWLIVMIFTFFVWPHICSYLITKKIVLAKCPDSPSSAKSCEKHKDHTSE